MKFKKPFTIQEIASIAHAKIIGNDQLLATGINEIHHVEAGDITFVDFEKYYNKALKSNADIIIIDKEYECPEGKCLLVCDNPFEAYNEIVKRNIDLRPLSSNISTEAKIADNVILEPNVFIGPEVSIDSGCLIKANTVIRGRVHIGKNVIIGSSTVIGSDAFYFKKENGHYKKWNTAGGVRIEDNAYIGALCTINSGVSSDTVIGEGTKLDCHIHIGHDVKVGKNCLFAAEVGIAGNTIIEDDVVLYGQVGVVQNLTVGTKAVVTAKSLVTKSIKEGKLKRFVK